MVSMTVLSRDVTTPPFSCVADLLLAAGQVDENCECGGSGNVYGVRGAYGTPLLECTNCDAADKIRQAAEDAAADRTED